MTTSKSTFTALFVEQAFQKPVELSGEAFDRLVDLVYWGGVGRFLSGQRAWDHAIDRRVVELTLDHVEDHGSATAYGNVCQMVEHALWGRVDEARECIRILLADLERPRDDENFVAVDEFQACWEEDVRPRFRNQWWETTRLWERLADREREGVLQLLREPHEVE